MGITGRGIEVLGCASAEVSSKGRMGVVGLRAGEGC
jgi:hypothetical protein